MNLPKCNKVKKGEFEKKQTYNWKTNPPSSPPIVRLATSPSTEGRSCLELKIILIMKNIIARQLPSLAKEGNEFTEVQQGKERGV